MGKGKKKSKLVLIAKSLRKELTGIKKNMKASLR